MVAWNQFLFDRVRIELLSLCVTLPYVVIVGHRWLWNDTAKRLMMYNVRNTGKYEVLWYKVDELQRWEDAAGSERVRMEERRRGAGWWTNVSFMGWGRTEMAQRGAKLTPLQDQHTGTHQWHHPSLLGSQLQPSEGMWEWSICRMQWPLWFRCVCCRFACFRMQSSSDIRSGHVWTAQADF